MRPPPVYDEKDLAEANERLAAVDTRSIKKVAEAKFRKKKRAEAKMSQARKRASTIMEQDDVPDGAARDVRPAGMPWPGLGEVPAAGTLSNVAAEDEEVEILRRRLEPVRARLGDKVADLLLDLAFFHKREESRPGGRSSTGSRRTATS